MEQNKLKRIKAHLSKDRDEWNTLELKGYNDDVLKRSPGFEPKELTERGKHSEAVITVPDWKDPSTKYIQKELSHHSGNKSVDIAAGGSNNKHFLYPLLNKSKRRQFKKNMEIYCRQFNANVGKQKCEPDKIPDFERKYNQKLVKLIKKNVDDTEELKMPGTLVGDQRMNIQLAKFIENDNRRTLSNQGLSQTEDPFKTRDQDYMKYKYRLKELANSYKPYQTSN